MDTLDLAALLTPQPTGQGGRFTLDVPDGLQQGRGAWGGVATGAMTAAAQLFDPRPELAVRTLSAHLVAPVPVGRARIVVEVLRRGSATTTLGARLLDSEGILLAHAVVVLAEPRSGQEMPDGPGWRELEAPSELVRGAEGVPVVELRPPLAPDFTPHLEFRPVLGRPYGGSSSGLTTGWVRPRAAVSRVDAALVVALADAWWVSVMARMERIRPAATIGFTLDLLGDPTALQRDAQGLLEPLFHRGRMVAARQGFTVETRELWTRRGELVSWNTQTVAVIA